MAYTIQQQSILFNADYTSVLSSIESIDRAVELAERSGIIKSFTLRYGDCSPTPCFTDEQICEVRERFPRLNFDYLYFKSNLGSALGHNTLAEHTVADTLIIQNPDVVVSPRLYERILEPLSDPSIGMCEAKQLPIEHPKEYDVTTGDTSWASTACAAIPTRLFKELKGFDNETFFLYCDDVDMSWRIRLAGYRVIYQPSAVVFHDKRFSATGEWQPSSAERYYSAEAALLLSYKWSREDITESIIKHFNQSGDEFHNRALAEFTKRRDEGRLPKQIDPSHKVGQFIHGNYARHRYAI